MSPTEKVEITEELQRKSRRLGISAELLDSISLDEASDIMNGRWENARRAADEDYDEA